MDKLIKEFEFTNIGRRSVTSRVGVRFGVPIIHNITDFNDLLWYIDIDGGHPQSEYPIGPLAAHRFVTWLEPGQTRLFVTGTGADFPANKAIEKDLDGMVKHILGLGDRHESSITGDEYKEAANQGPVRGWMSALNNAISESQLWYEEGAELSGEQQGQLLTWQQRMKSSTNLQGKESFLGILLDLYQGRKLKVPAG
jgi:hypothetical protein